MKKLSLLFSVFILLTAFTCENEPLEGDFVTDDPNQNSIIGEWTTVAFEATITTSNEVAGEIFEIEILAEGSNFDYNVVFNNSTYTTSGGYDMETSTIVNGEINDSLTSTLTDVNGQGNYSISGNIMTIDGSFFEVDGAETDGGIQTAEFVLSADGQTLTFNQDEILEENSGDVNVVIHTVSTTVLQRL